MRVGLGFFCSTSDNRLSTNHKLRLNRLNQESLYKVFIKNMEDLLHLLDLSRKLGLTIFRLGSNFIPFASHPNFEKEWLEDIKSLLRENSRLIKSYGIRITMHPGQYVVLNSNNHKVVEKSLKELEYHMWVLDTLELGPDSIIVVHVGGVYGDKSLATKRLYETLEDNKWLLRRLALENDERHYNVREVLNICESFGIPVVYDHYHHKLNPSQFDVDKLVSTWRGIPLEIHVSSMNERKSKFGEHGDFVKLEDFVEAIDVFPESVNIDVIIEAKMKERAIMKLINDIRSSRPELMKRVVFNYSIESLNEVLD